MPEKTQEELEAIVLQYVMAVMYQSMPTCRKEVPESWTTYTGDIQALLEAERTSALDILGQIAFNGYRPAAATRRLDSSYAAIGLVAYALIARDVKPAGWRLRNLEMDELGLLSDLSQKIVKGPFNFENYSLACRWLSVAAFRILVDYSRKVKPPKPSDVTPESDDDAEFDTDLSEASYAPRNSLQASTPTVEAGLQVKAILNEIFVGWIATLDEGQRELVKRTYVGVRDGWKATTLLRASGITSKAISEFKKTMRSSLESYSREPHVAEIIRKMRCSREDFLDAANEVFGIKKEPGGRKPNAA